MIAQLLTLPLIVFALVAEPALGPAQGAKIASAPASAKPSPQGQAAIESLRKAFAAEDRLARARAIEDAAPISDAALIEWFKRGLGDSDAYVKQAAIQALRTSAQASAIGVLEDFAQRDATLRKNGELYTLVLKAIGQHGSASSIDLLVDDLWSVPEQTVLEARIFSLARIRHLAAVEKLFGLMKQAGSQKLAPYMDELRIALMLLTGADEGTSQEQWMRWWNEHRGNFVVATDAPRLPPALQIRWELFWGLPVSYPRPTPRNDRGKNDP